MSPPPLSRQDVTDQLEKLYSEKGRRLFAFYGEGIEESVALPAGLFSIVPVRSELELRERMIALDDDARVAFLVPWTTEVPVDLAGRFARSGRVFRVGKDERLRKLLGASEIEPDLEKSPLATYLLASPTNPSMKAPSGRLTAVALWNTWLQAAWRVDTTGGLGLDTLLAWAALDQHGPAFVQSMGAPIAAGVRDALLVHLKGQLGVAGPVVWRAWESGKGRLVLAYALLFEELVKSEHAGVKMWISLAPRAALGVGPEGDMPTVAAALGATADGALRLVEREQPSVARAIAKEADGLVENPEVREALARHRRLPSAWKARATALGKALAAAESSPSQATVEAAKVVLDALQAHTFYGDPEQAPLIRRAEMAVRLAAFLAARPDREAQPGLSSYGDAEALGRWYVENGGYVDWARHVARGGAADELGRAIERVVAAVDVVRDELDLRFARSLSSWIDSGRPSSQVVPIDSAVTRVAVRFLEDNPARRLLVLLIDGMAWAQAVEILQSLGHRAIPWGPLAWHGTAKGKIGSSVYPPVFANLPTITDVSRAAFFGGKVIGPGAPWDTQKDPQRWGHHGDIARLVAEGDVAKLLLRAEGHTQAGAASQEALSLVADANRRIVAIVINAIDASLKGDPQERNEWTADSIKSLAPLLDSAREAGRAVLLASDHGHVPTARMKSVGTNVGGGGARWRPWASPSDSIASYEVGFRGNHVSSPKTAHGVVLLATDATRYGGAANAGEHGGASLAEVVAPCVLIGCEDLQSPAEPDPALAVRAAHVPSWWHFDVRPPVAIVDEPTPAPKPKKPVNTAQLELLAVAPPPAPTVEQRVSVFGSSFVLASLVKKPEERRKIVEAVEFLLDRGGVVTDAAFATAIQEPEWRIGGVVAKLQEVLNIEGYQVIQYDPSKKMIRLQREMLAQQFEVEL